MNKESRQLSRGRRGLLLKASKRKQSCWSLTSHSGPLQVWDKMRLATQCPSKQTCLISWRTEQNSAGPGSEDATSSSNLDTYLAREFKQPENSSSSSPPQVRKASLTSSKQRRSENPWKKRVVVWTVEHQKLPGLYLVWWQRQGLGELWRWIYKSELFLPRAQRSKLGMLGQAFSWAVKSRVGHLGLTLDSVLGHLQNLNVEKVHIRK